MNPIFSSSPSPLWKTCRQNASILAILLLLTLATCAPSPADPAEAITEVPATSPPTQTATPLPSPTATPVPTPTAKPQPTATQLEGRRGLIAFAMAYEWGGIHVIQADGSSDPVMLSMHPSIDSRPSWSPDGSQIAFESFRDDPVAQEHMDIYIMNSDGSQLTRLTNTDGWYTQPDWSPDGSRIAMFSAESQDSGDADLSVLDLNTRELTRLTEGPAVDMEPSWSPDASQIAFASDRDGSVNVYTLNVETGETTQLTQGSDNYEPDWSPDGEKILFVSYRDGDEEIYVMDTDGANQSRLTTAPGRDVDPEWSPDGNYFVYSHEEAGVPEIYVLDLNDSTPALLFDNPDEARSFHPVWTVAQTTISEDPVFGPPVCMRDTDGNSRSDTPTTTFSTEDDMAFIVFPYDHMQDGMDFWYTLSTTGKISITGENHPQPWDGGEEGLHITYSTLQHTPGAIKVELYLGEELMQEIECEVVEP